MLIHFAILDWTKASELVPVSRQEYVLGIEAAT